MIWMVWMVSVLWQGRNNSTLASRVVWANNIKGFLSRLKYFELIARPCNKEVSVEHFLDK